MYETISDRIDFVTRNLFANGKQDLLELLGTVEKQVEESVKAGENEDALSCISSLLAAEESSASLVRRVLLGDAASSDVHNSGALRELDYWLSNFTSDPKQSNGAAVFGLFLGYASEKDPEKLMHFYDLGYTLLEILAPGRSMTES